MLTMLRDIWLYTMGRPSHPVYRRELTGWSYWGLWRRMRAGCIPAMAALMLASAACCGLSLLVTGEPELTSLPVIVIGAMVGVFIAGEMIHGLASLLSTALTSTVIAAEIEAQTYDLVSLTMVTPHDFVLSKFGAAVHQLRLPIFTVIITRVFVTAGSLCFLTIYLIYEVSRGVAGTAGGPSPAPFTSPPLPLPVLPSFAAESVTLTGVAVLLIIIVAILWYVYFLFQPLLTVSQFSALGVLASAWAKSRTNGLLTAIGFRFLYWLGSYILTQIIQYFITFATFPLFILPGFDQFIEQLATVRPSILVIGGAGTVIISTVLGVSFQLLIIAGSLHLAARRAARLPHNV
jgi:hypothetical protein